MKSCKTILSLFALLLLAISCSQREADIDNGADTSPVAAADTVYFRLHLEMPAADDTDTTATRAANPLDGSDEEYKIHDGLLMLFHGTDPQTAVLKEVYELIKSGETSSDPKNESGWKKDAVTQITQTDYVVKTITDSDNKNIYALVMVNSSANGILNKTEAEAEDKTGKTFTNAFGGMTINTYGDDTKGYFMSNAPMLDKNKNAITQINVTNLFKSGDAVKSDATIVCLERAAAKVTVSWNKTRINYNGITIKGNNSDVPIKVNTIKWGLDHTNSSCYALRQFELGWLTDNSNFASDFPIGDVLNTHFFRTLWAKDQNYVGTGPALSSITEPAVTNGSGTTAYCFENTTDPTNMTPPNLTRIILAVTITDESGVIITGDCWGVSSGTDHQRIFTTEKACDDYIAAKGLNSTDVKRKFTNGTMYYPIYIRHLDDTELGSNELGKYGVVRDHWYRITLTKFDHIGWPSISDIPTSF